MMKEIYMTIIDEIKVATTDELLTLAITKTI